MSMEGRRTIGSRTIGRFTRLYAWIPVLIGVVAILSVALGVLAGMVLRQTLLTQSGERLAVAAGAVAEKLDRTLFERYGDIQVLARTAAHVGRDPTALTAFLHEYQETYTFYDWLAVANAQGRIIAATDPASIGQLVASAAWFQAARITTTARVWDVGRPPAASASPVVMFSMPVLGADGSFLGAVASHVPLSRLEDIVSETVVALLAQQGTTGRIEYHLLRADGELLADSLLRQEGRVNLFSLGLRSARLAAEGPAGFVEEDHLRRGIRVVTGYARTKGFERFPGVGWLVLVRMDRDDLLAPVAELEERLALLGVAGLLPALGLLLWIAHRLERERGRAVAAEASEHEHARRLEALVEAGEALARDLDLDRLLRDVLDGARKLIGARYAALGVLDKTETHLIQFLTSGVDDAVQQAIGTLPTGRGLLGHLVREEGPLRLADLSQHPAFTGFPPHHPPMRSFLGCSIRARGRVFGRLYLTDKLGRDGNQIEFTEQDAQILVWLAAQAGIAIENCFILQEVREKAAQLERSNTALLAAIREVEEMTSVVAHDLKAPLVTIQGYAGRLEAAFADHPDERGRRAIAVIREVSKTMGAMLDGLLEVSRLHRRSLRPRRVGVAETVEQVSAGLAEQIAAAGATIMVHLDPAAQSVWMDPVAFHEVIQNLLSNALKFGAPDRSLAIEIGTAVQASRVRVWVRDNGIGIPADKREAVFQIFRKLNRNTPGVGIGLAAVRKLVQQSGGTVWIESEPGEGTTVLMTLPAGEG